VKTLAFAIGLCILAVGVIGMVAPSTLVAISHQFTTAAAWLALGVVRIAVGLLLVLVARSSRTPRALCVVAFIPLLAGIGALAIPLIGVEHAQALLDRWSSEGPGLTRLTGIPLVALGGFIAYACQPTRRVH